jgi:S-adenosylmethionine:tRNA ribosyltransferase-isomerase
VNLADFDFELPAGRIAQEPLSERDASRLLVLDRAANTTAARTFRELRSLLRAGDVLVLNDTRVLPARLVGSKASGGRVEIFLLEPDPRGEVGLWRCLTRSSKPLQPGATVDFGGAASAVVLAREGETWTVRLRGVNVEGNGAGAAPGRVPLPPYIRRADSDPREALDRERYQTVFARRPGAVAAPTAGLHFTPALLDEIRAAGVEVAFLTLHVGSGTFLPIRTENVDDHRMHAERFEIPQATAESVRRARGRRGRVVAVGTTVVRTLEARATDDGCVLAGSGTCDLFIRPGHAFRVVDALVTNFHLPRSSLLLLVCAFAGTQRVLAAYREAIADGYRFYSYGDAMWIE